TAGRQSHCAGDSRQHGAASDRSRTRGDSRTRAGGSAWATAKPRDPETGCTPEAAARQARTGKTKGKETPLRRYALWSSEEPPSFMPSLKFLMALPTPLPSCGRRFAPKINTTITRITRSSGKPRLPILLLLENRALIVPLCPNEPPSQTELSRLCERPLKRSIRLRAGDQPRHDTPDPLA